MGTEQRMVTPFAFCSYLLHSVSTTLKFLSGPLPTWLMECSLVKGM